MVDMLYNSSQIIGQTIDGATSNITGSVFLTMMGLIILLVVIGIIFRMDIIFVAVFLVPILSVIIAFASSIGLGTEFNSFLIVILVFLGITLGVNWFISVR